MHFYITFFNPILLLPILGSLGSHFVMINSDLHEHLEAESLCDNLIVDHLRPQRLFLVEYQGLRGLALERVLNHLLVPCLQVLLETVLIVDKENHIQDAKKREVTTDLLKPSMTVAGVMVACWKGLLSLVYLKKMRIYWFSSKFLKLSMK